MKDGLSNAAQDPLATRPSLLLRLRDPRNDQAWSEFAAIYLPLIYRFAQRRGLQDADAADLAQEVLRSVAGAIGKFDYDGAKGAFRGWVITVARSKLSDLTQRRARQPVGSGDSSLQQWLDHQPDGSQDEAEFIEREYRQCVFEAACRQVQPQFAAATWEAFWLTHVEGHSTKEAAEKLGLTAGAVYIARSRVLAALKECIAALTEPGDE